MNTSVVQTRFPKTQPFLHALDNDVLKRVHGGYIKSTLADLTRKMWFVDRSVEQFELSCKAYCEWCVLNPGKRVLSREIMDCYFYFESFLYQARSNLDLLARAYGFAFHNLNGLKYSKFSSFYAWVLKNATDQGLPREIVDYFTRSLAWFPDMKEIRDTIAHRQGYNPLTGVNNDGSIYLGFCAIPSFDVRFWSSKADDLISTWHDGISDLFTVSDGYLFDRMSARVKEAE